MGNFKWFTDAEIAGLETPLPAMLDAAASLIRMDPRIKDPRVILTFTIGGQHCGNSTHYKGLAVDIGLAHLAEGFERDAYRWALYKALFASGFERVEVAPLHCHADIGHPPDYPSPDMWIGSDS